MTNLAKLVLAKTGLSLKDYCEQHLKSEYKTFQMRMRKQKYYAAEVIYTCWLLDSTCKEAFGKEYLDLVMFQGKNEVPEKARQIWNEADANGKNRLLALVGLTKFIDVVPVAAQVIPEAPKKDVAPVIKATPKPIQSVDFFQDIESDGSVKAAPEADLEPEAPKNSDPLQGLFIETYN